jgi:methionine synthase I (cobalamin-dependent)
MHTLIENLIKNGVVITDGAWGTQLQQQGLKGGENPDSWNLVNPAIVEQIPRNYMAAGSKVVLTNTFGANRRVLEKCALTEKVYAINKAGAEISKRAAGKDALVFASIGPTGKLLPPKASAGSDLIDVFEEQARALRDGGADALVVETMMDLREAVAAVTGAKKTGLAVIACMVFDSGKNKDRTMMGNTIEDAVRALSEAGADAVGANCGQGPEGFLPVCQRMRQLTTLPVWMKPNAGLPTMVNGVSTYTTGPEAFATEAAKLVDAGADFIGGCCGTSPDYIRALAAKLAGS